MHIADSINSISHQIPSNSWQGYKFQKYINYLRPSNYLLHINVFLPSDDLILLFHAIKYFRIILIYLQKYIIYIDIFG